MLNKEFIIILSEHRFLGSVFTPYFIQNSGKYYTILAHIKPEDLKNENEYVFTPYEKHLVELSSKFSDQRLMKKFSRAANVSEFYNTLAAGYLEKHILPVVQKYLFQIAEILMLSPIRLFRKEAGYAKLYDEDVIQTHPVYARQLFYFERNELEIKYKLIAFIGDNEINLNDRLLRIISGEPCLLLYKNHLVAFESLNSKKLQPFMEKEFVKIPKAMEEKYFSGFILNTIREYDVKASGFQIITENPLKTGELSIEKNLRDEFALVLSFVYGHERFELNSNRKLSVKLNQQNDSYLFHKIYRDENWEKTILKSMSELGLKEDNGFFIPAGWELLEKENALYYLINWLNRFIPELEKRGIKVSKGKMDKPYFTGLQEIETKIKTEGDWFDVFIRVRFGEYLIPFVKLKKYILNNIREFVLPDGQIAILPDEWLSRYKGLFPLAHTIGDSLRFRDFHFTLIQNRIKVFDTKILERFKNLELAENIKTALPENLNATLREYQEEGFRWMVQLQKFGFGGCLADDMGLGKTLQTLTLLLKSEKPKTNLMPELNEAGQISHFSQPPPELPVQPASLIIMPTSLVHNWYNEIQKFTPGLRVYLHVGIQRKTSDLEKISREFDIVLTTYGTLRLDSELFNPIEFFYLILDESQLIKNPASKTYKAVVELKSKFRLVLTGTPIENSLSDLWSQMNFLNKGILGNLPYFRKFFIIPIEKNQNREQQEKLQEMIRPFILRRKKDEVAKDLPPLMEQVIYCEMGSEQSKKYETEKSIIRNSILESIENEGINKTSFIILQGFTRLRQLANHPSMLDKEAQIESGKFDEICRMLENVVAEKHKVLVFSSFVEHLELIRKQVETNGWKYSILTGQTTKREKVIKEFQEDAENRIFLISLKAGGVGLNLTEADYVFIIDPWWNPAAENQAINRAHRIGQNKHVFVYRFITEGSIEEKIQQLKERKSQLADKFINSNNPFESVTREEILEML